MRVLLGYIGKDKQADALMEKLLARFDGPGPLSRDLAFCLSQVGCGSVWRVRPAYHLAECLDWLHC